MDLILCHNSLNYKGGAERLVLEIAKKFNPIIYTIEYDQTIGYPEFKEFDIRILRPKIPAAICGKLFSSDRRVTVAAIAACAFLFHKFKEDYDVINPHGIPCEWIRNNNSRVCWYMHGPLISAFDSSLNKKLHSDKNNVVSLSLEAYKIIEAAIVPKIEKICTNSEISKEKFRRFHGREDLEVIYPGIDASAFKCKSFEKYFIYASRIAPEKRMEMAIRAFQKFGRKDWKLVIAGFLSDSLRDQKYYQYLQNIASKTKVKFVINPSDEQLRDLYANCYATLFTAAEEHFGIAPLEMMASGKPCISVNEGGPTISILCGKTGFLVDSEEDITKKMSFLADNPDINMEMGQFARKHVMHNYSLENFLAKMAAAFRETARKC